MGVCFVVVVVVKIIKKYTGAEHMARVAQRLKLAYPPAKLPITLNQTPDLFRSVTGLRATAGASR